ncbi:peroxidase-like [Eupeodes corollae]|uniref:peroxidase-like n=1 Tax=Eupeodes corollae TaxID=290404 RepID=UPI00248F64C0|nr:peroxidase-like [Eupeodes corollae]
MNLNSKIIIIIILSAVQNVIISALCPHNPIANFGRPQTPTDTDFCNLQPKTCDKDSKYRSLDGSCNNLINPYFCLANYKFARILPAKYSDGISQPTRSGTGEPLPNARLISLSLFGEQYVEERDLTLMNMEWGQVISGDISRIARGTSSSNYVPCCTSDGHYVEQNREICFNLDIPPEDLVNIKASRECMEFVRTLTDRDSNCNYKGGPVEQLNAVTSYLDMSILYGNTDDVNRGIRAFKGGLLIVDQRNGQSWLPKNPNSTEVCNVDSENDVCYKTGDIRVNSAPGISVLETIFLREHNRLADELAKLNPHWCDEELFQEARKILIAQLQHITYYELLPIFLGRENMLKNKLIYDVPPESHVNDYNPGVDATTLNEFTTGAFRHFHTVVAGRLNLVTEVRNLKGSLRVSDWYNRPGIIEVEDNFDMLCRGLGSQPQRQASVDNELKNFPFKKNMSSAGLDMRAIDIHRGRDHGLASYNDFRQFCGIKRAKNWEDFKDLINTQSIEGLKKLYKSPEDVDLIVGGALEYNVEGTLAGPTFLCILTEQFYRTRVGDRFFFENDNPTIGFRKDQLREIRKATAARLMCDNGNRIQTMQPKAFISVSKTNPIVPCEELPKIDLSKWSDGDKN